MKVSRAIEILQEKQQENEPHWERGDRDAIKLGIEALKRHGKRRSLAGDDFYEPLPGEAKMNLSISGEAKMNLSIFIVALLLLPISILRLLMWMLAIPWLCITKRQPFKDFNWFSGGEFAVT